MRESVQKLGFCAEKYGDLTLMRFLKARSMDVDKAGQMFVEWVQWRDSFVPSGVIDDTEVADELEQEKIYLQGLSRNGNPVIFVRACKHEPNKDHLQFKKFAVHILDKTITSSFRGHQAGNEKIITVIDLQGISYKNVDIRAFVTGFQLVQSYYPERLEKCFLLNMPWFFVSVWKMLSRFLDKATSEKMKIVSSKAEKEEFTNEVGATILPEMCGGNSKLTLLQDVKLTQPEVALQE